MFESHHLHCIYAAACPVCQISYIQCHALVPLVELAEMPAGISYHNNDTSKMFAS